jgi:hypothetical protein
MGSYRASLGLFFCAVCLCGAANDAEAVPHFDINDHVMKIDTWGAFPQQNQIIDTLTITKSADRYGVASKDAGPADATATTSSEGLGSKPDAIAKDLHVKMDGQVAQDATAKRDVGGADSGRSQAKTTNGCSCHAAAGGKASALWLLIWLIAWLLRCLERFKRSKGRTLYRRIL